MIILLETFTTEYWIKYLDIQFSNTKFKRFFQYDSVGSREINSVVRNPGY